MHVLATQDNLLRWWSQAEGDKVAQEKNIGGSWRRCQAQGDSMWANGMSWAPKCQGGKLLKDCPDVQGRRPRPWGYCTAIDHQFPLEMSGVALKALYNFHVYYHCLADCTQHQICNQFGSIFLYTVIATVSPASVMSGCSPHYVSIIKHAYFFLIIAYRFIRQSLHR